VVREGVGAGGEMTQALYAHMNNKTIKKNTCVSRRFLEAPGLHEGLSNYDFKKLHISVGNEG
jgi:hypothetical protein